MNHPPRGIYRHYKGRDYEVLGVARQSETDEEYVVYRALYGEHGLWARPLSMFTESVQVDGELMPRFHFIGPSGLRKLTAERQAAARAFLLNEARPLERALYQHEFEGGSADAAFAALAAYANPDGGFGHGLEPDLRTRNSSVLATSTALQHLHAVGAMSDHPLVAGAMAFLATVFDHEHARWPFIPPTANDAPHAPWWTVDDEHPAWFRGYAVYPRAELVAWHHVWRELADDGILAAAEEALVQTLASLTRPLDLNEVLSVARLARAESAPPWLRDAARTAVEESLPATLALDAERWTDYTLQPLALAPTPGGPFAHVVDPFVDDNLAFRMDNQEQSGAWSPAWTWGDLYPDTWPQARREWQGVLTLEALRTFQAYGRLAL